MHEHWPILVWVAYGGPSNAVAQPDRRGEEESTEWRNYRSSLWSSYRSASHVGRAGTWSSLLIKVR